jgi:hypothetical protein
MVSGVQADPTRNVVEGPAASTDKIAETAKGVIKGTADSSCQLQLEGTATPLHQCRPVAGAHTIADGIVVLSAMAIAAAREMEVSFKLSAAAGTHSHTFARMQACGWCSYDGLDSERGIRGYRRWNRGSELDVHSCGKKR